MAYTNLEQRMIHTYIDMFPPFLPSKDLPENAQKQFYLFMQNLFETIHNTPKHFFSKINEDDAYPRRFNRASYGKPELYNKMKHDLQDIDDFLLSLFEIGKDGFVVENGIRTLVKIKKKHLNWFSALGLRYDEGAVTHEKYNDMFRAWKYLAMQENATVVTFSRCMFDRNHSYMEDIYSSLFEADPFNKIVGILKDHGYKRYEMARGEYTLDYAKNITTKATDFNAPLGNSLHGDPHHIGFSFEYNPFAAVPQYTVIRIVKMKEILLRIDQAPANVKDFVIQYKKKCDNCGYCTQTDKTGNKPKQIVAVDEHEICALYPGFDFCLTRIDDKTAKNVIDLILFMERVVNSK